MDTRSNKFVILVYFCAIWSISFTSDNVPRKCAVINQDTLVFHDVIPSDVPPDVRNVVLRDFTDDLVVNQTQLSGSGWKEILNLTIINLDTERSSTFDSLCFANLRSLIEIHVHTTHNHFGNGLFANLTNLRVLDLSNCTYLSNNELFSNFNTTTSLPVLEKLILFNAGSMYRQGLTLTSDFLGALTNRPVTYLDISYATIADVNVTAANELCQNLITLLMRGTLLSHSYGKVKIMKACGKLKMLDFSYIRGPKNEFCFIPPIVNMHNLTMDLDVSCKFLSRVESIFANHLCDVTKLPKIFRNVTGIRIKPPEVEYNWKFLYINHNYLHYLDIEIICNNSGPPVLGTKGLYMKSNGLKFVRPSFFYCMFGHVEVLDLSDNELNVMFLTDPPILKTLFSSLSRLQVLNLSNNGFEEMRGFDFTSNTRLQTIDLSGNYLSTIRMVFSKQCHLLHLDLSRNKLERLNQESIATLNTLISTCAESNIAINLAGNPLNCFECDHFVSIQWVFKNYVHLTAYEETKCWNDKHVLVPISEGLVDDLDDFCQRPVRTRNIVVVISVLAAFLITLFVAVVSFRRLRNRRWKRLNRDALLAQLRENEEGYEFLVFLSYSSNDEEFVRNMVLRPLKATLSQATGIERSLICTGDTHFRVGQPIHNEMASCLHRSAVVVIVLSDDFLLSQFCQLEFQQAFQLGKPVLLMVKGKVNTELMSVAMSELYHSFARVHWDVVEERLELKCTWDHVGECIVLVGSERRLWQQ